MDPIIFYPDPRFKTKVKVAALLLMVVTVFWWSIPVTFLAGYELSGIALGLILVLIGHGALIWITFWATNLYYNSIRYE
ncbi:MAG: hypothetical protein JXQ72_00210, partial [Anaerolineae bacterium]|nr:hypothetical protein [Anaerolineae bacterium]